MSVLFTFPERLHRVSLHGGTPQEAWKMHGISPTIAGDNLYWMAPRPDEQVILQDGNTFRYERSIGHSDLMTMPLTGGPARKLLSGLSTGIFLLAGTDGVCWTVPHAYPDRRVDLYRCRAADTRPLLIADYNGFPGNESVPVEFQGRLYWFGTRVDPNRQRTGYVQDCLMSANADGSDRRIMPSPIDRWRTAKSPLVPHRGYLYFAYEDTQRGRDPSYYLYRLSSGPAGKGEIVRKLPDLSYDPQFDGDYLYFTTAQRHKSLFDWLTDDDAHVKTTAAKYRLHLPD